MMKVVYSEMDTPAGISCRLEAAGHAGYAPAGQDIVCAGASTVMQGLVCLLAGEESARSDAFDEPDGPRLAVQADAPCAEWVQGAFELAKACFALLAERYPENVRFADVSRRGEKSMMDLQLFAAAEATAACGGNREPRLGQRPAEHECRSRHEVGAVKLKLWALRPGKALKDLYAQAGIPAYVRVDMPKLWLNNELLFAAGLGMDVRFADDPAKYPDRVKFLWRPDRSLWDARPMPNYAELPEAERRMREERVREAAKSSIRFRESIARERSAEKNR